MTAIIEVSQERLPLLIERAAAALASATTAAEVLDVQRQTQAVYTSAKAAARFAEAKEAHDTVIAACRRAMGDAQVIEARAQCRLADEYDVAQQRGEVATKSYGGANISNGISKQNTVATVTDIGLTSQQIHAARRVRDAEAKDPGIVVKVIEGLLATGEEPTRSKVRRAVMPPTLTSLAKKAILADPTRSQQSIAEEIGTSQSVVSDARAALIKENQIPARRPRKPKEDTLPAHQPVQVLCDYMHSMANFMVIMKNRRGFRHLVEPSRPADKTVQILFLQHLRRVVTSALIILDEFGAAPMEDVDDEVARARHKMQMAEARRRFRIVR